MQSLTIPDTFRNPNGYTAAEIQAALQGDTGSRKFSFRYELLDSRNKFKRDLDTIKSCRISQNWLAEVKRTATFDLRAGFEDPIDYLSDRIKPWVRLHMPPKAIPEPDLVLPEPATPPAFAAFLDDFSTAEMGTNWDHYVNGVANVGGQLRLPAWGAAGTPEAESNTTWSLTGSYVTAELVHPAEFGEVGDQVSGTMVVYSNSDSTNFTIRHRRAGSTSTNRLEFQNNQGSTDPDQVIIDYDPDEHRWFRIRESGGTVFFETSRTGFPGTWQVQKSVATPTWVVSQDPTHSLAFRTAGNVDQTDYYGWDNVGLTPEGVETTFMPQRVWANNFNGTPGVTGEEITTNNSARHGEALDDVLGTAIYDETYSSDSSKSAKLGDDSGTSGGTLVARMRTALTEWSMRFYYRMAAGGVLTVQPDGANPDSSNDIVIDDATNTFTLGTVSIPALYQPELVDQLVKVEVITTETLTIYRLFWTDPAGDSPDYVTSEDNTDRDPLITVTIEGGGSTTPPVWFDNLTVNEPQTFEPFTDDSVNYVEWPQGVFILSSPQRQADTASVVSRDIQGYDLGQVLQDDLAPDRFSTANLLRVDDNFSREVSGSLGTSQDGTVWVQAASNATVGVSAESPGYAFVTLLSSPSSIRLFQAGNTSQEVLVDSEVYTRISVNETATGASFLPGVIFRLFTASDYYRLRIHHQTDSGISLSVTRQSTQFGSTVTTDIDYTPGEYVNVRAQCIGHVIKGKVWLDGTPEPLGWMIEEEITADQIEYGYTGFSASAFGGNTNVNPTYRYDLFQLNPNPLNLYTEVVHHILHQLNLHHNLTPSDKVLPTVREWPAGTSSAQIINELLAAINYESLSFDENGVAVIKPYVSPQDRGAEFEYRDNELSVLYPEMMHELDLFNIPNRWILTVSDPDREAISVVFTNNDPASPTSTVRRGRTITEFVQEQDAPDESTLIEKASRKAFETSQVYEAVEFSTGLMPIHSGNDVYALEYDPMGINAQYVEHTWDMELKAGARMTHRARRIISVTAAQDPSLLTDNLVVTGALEAGNIDWGIESVTPVANVPTAKVITGLNLQGTGPVRVIVTAETTVPGSTLKEVSTTSHSPYGFTIWVYRTNTTATNIHWLALRGA